MSIITDYISNVKSAIDKLPCVISNELIIDNRGDVVLYLKDIIVFTNQSELHLKEYCISLPEFKKIAYSYHFQGTDRKLVFRYDNAEHHPEELTLNEVLELIIADQNGSFKFLKE
ncbi:MAG TPA: DUF6516 family protein [Candidatus Kapabacteria bacterium]|nr:DUF6516 family protein [Candidatus Kapabacteria bacterium]